MSNYKKNLNAKEELRKEVVLLAIDGIANGVNSLFVENAEASAKVITDFGKNKYSISSIYYIKEKNGNEKIIPEVIVNAKEVMEKFFTLHKDLTYKMKTEFYKNYDGKTALVLEMEKWLIKNGYEIGDFQKGRMVYWNYDRLSFYDYVHFVDKKTNKEGLATVWDLSGEDIKEYGKVNPDVWNQHLKVWICDMGKIIDFISVLIPDAQKVVALKFGYKGNWLQLEQDLKEIIKEEVEKYKKSQQQEKPKQKSSKNEIFKGLNRNTKNKNISSKKN